MKTAIAEPDLHYYTITYVFHIARKYRKIGMLYMHTLETLYGSVDRYIDPYALREAARFEENSHKESI